jgi:hypothetical protein
MPPKGAFHSDLIEFVCPRGGPSLAIKAVTETSKPKCGELLSGSVHEAPAPVPMGKKF